MRTLFYEDMQYLYLEKEAQPIITWYERWCLKESRFLVGHKNQLTRMIRQDPSELVLFSNLFVGDGDTLEELEANLKAHGYVFRHKKDGERTEQMNATLMHVNSGDFFADGIERESYTLLDYSAHLYEKDKTFSDTDFLKMIGGHHIDRRHKRQNKKFKPEADGKHRILFYEDIEQVRFDEFDVLFPWYQARADELNEHYVTEREALITEYKKGFYIYDEKKYNSLIHYTPRQVTGETQEDLERALKQYGYRFKHKEAGERTEQRTAKLFKVIESSKTGETDKVSYAFLGFKEEISPVTDPEQRFEG